MKLNPKSLFFLILLSCASPKESDDSLEILDPEMESFFSENSQVEVLAAGFDWAEGPLWLPDQEALIFTDVPKNKIWKWTELNGVSLFLEPSGYLGERTDKNEPGANGLILNENGELVLCQHGERQVAKMLSSLSDPEPKFEPIAQSYEGKKLNSPNDLIYNSKGQLFFTDPPYGMDPWDEKELDFQGVYRVDPDGELILLIDSLSRPNGIGLSPDQKTLYIGQSDPEKASYYAFDLDGNGNVIGGKMILDVTHLQSDEKKGLPDGLTVHSSGTIFATGPGGVLVISPEGKHLGTILTGEATANCAFDPEERFLYMAADSFLMRIFLK
jgi:gluconolactonase